MLRLRHLRTRPATPTTHGKAEGFIQTLVRESAYALPYRSSETRAADLPNWLRRYHYERPQASLARQSPTA
jgi:transposase InsO family protein